MPVRALKGCRWGQTWGRAAREGGSIFPEAPKLNPRLQTSSPPKHPSFLAFPRARAWCLPFKCKELRSAPWAHSGAGIVLEVNVAVPTKTGKVGAAPRRGGTRCYCAQRLAPLKEGGPGVGQGWQELAASAHVPCRPGRGLP